MKTLLYFVPLCGVLLIAAPAMAQETPKKKEGFGWYVGAYGGVAIPETFDNVRTDSFSIGDLKLKTGSMFGAKFGFTGHSKDQVWRYFGAELDLSITNTAIRAQSWRVSGGGLNGSIPASQADLRFFTTALHFMARWPDGPVRPYVGAGPAIVHGSVSRVQLGGIPVGDSSGTSIGLSAVAGVGVKIKDQFGMFVEYKQIRAAMEFDNLKGDAVVHAGVVGVNVSF
ncbi:MAG: outer membrane beta-barrel protein [Nitrospira sp.]